MSQNKLIKTKRGYILGPMEISNPFDSFPGGMTVRFEIDLNELVDGYDYHDFPSSVNLYLDRSQIETLRNLLSELLENMK